MKLNGNVIEARYTKIVSFRRDPKPAIKFTLRSFKDDGTVEKLCPAPEAGFITKPGEGEVRDTESQSYQDILTEHNTKQMHYMILCTVQDVDWTTVDMEDPETWHKWPEEMNEAGFTPAEVIKFQTACFEVNGLSEPAIQDAEGNSSAGTDTPDQEE